MSWAMHESGHEAEERLKGNLKGGLMALLYTWYNYWPILYLAGIVLITIECMTGLGLCKMELKAQSLNVDLILGKVQSFSPDNLSGLIARIAC